MDSFDFRDRSQQRCCVGLGGAWETLANSLVVSGAVFDQVKSSGWDFVAEIGWADHWIQTFPFVPSRPQLMTGT